MAKHKKKRTKKISKGLRPSISNSTLRLVSDARDGAEIAFNKLEAWRAGKNPWFTISNPNSNETNKPFIRIKADRYFGGAYKEIRHRFDRKREVAQD